MSKDMDYYYSIHWKRGLDGFWTMSVCHTLEDIHQFIVNREEELSGAIVIIERHYGWDEQEHKELARLKKKYEQPVDFSR